MQSMFGQVCQSWNLKCFVMCNLLEFYDVWFSEHIDLRFLVLSFKLYQTIMLQFH